jgi:uncharacterized iron-regulated protein
MNHQLDKFGLTSLLDDLRAAYDLAKETGRGDLQARLMDARRTLVGVLHQHLELHEEVLALQEQLARRHADPSAPPRGTLFAKPLGVEPKPS